MTPFRLLDHQHGKIYDVDVEAGVVRIKLEGEAIEAPWGDGWEIEAFDLAEAACILNNGVGMNVCYYECYEDAKPGGRRQHAVRIAIAYDGKPCPLQAEHGHELKEGEGKL